MESDTNRCRYHAVYFEEIAFDFLKAIEHRQNNLFFQIQSSCHLMNIKNCVERHALKFGDFLQNNLSIITLWIVLCQFILVFKVLYNLISNY